MEKLKLALVYGSVREGRFCDKVMAWATAETGAHPEFEISVIDPRDYYRPLVSGNVHDPVMQDLYRLIGEADAFIVVTPEYNHSYPAALKLVIDAVFEQWQAKPVAFVSYGGVSGGLRAVEHLRHVFAELHAVSIRDSVSFPNAWNEFGADSKPHASAHRSMATMLDRLRWWASALRSARLLTPYNQAA